MAKTILKLYENGDFETVGVDVIKKDNINLIDVSTLTVGHIQNSNGEIIREDPTNRVTDFINVAEGESYSIHSKPIDDGAKWHWISVAYFDENYNYISEISIIDQQDVINLETTWICPVNVVFVRISGAYFESYSTSFKLNNTFPLSFSENSVTVPKIIEYPPPNYRNYFIYKTSSAGYLGYDNGIVTPSGIYSRSSDFITVSGWENATFRIEFYNLSRTAQTEAGIFLYNAQKGFHSVVLDSAVGGTAGGNHVFEYRATIPSDASFMRVYASDYDNVGVTTVKVSVERGLKTNANYYIAPEDMPDWVVDTGNPISIFPQGIVIKGDLIQTI